MCTAGPLDPMKIPSGLTCKNTFFDVPKALDEIVAKGPATCPPPTQGWWSSASTSCDVPESSTVVSPDIGPTPDWFSSYIPSEGPAGGRHFDRLLADAVAEDDHEEEASPPNRSNGAPPDPTDFLKVTVVGGQPLQPCAGSSLPRQASGRPWPLQLATLESGPKVLLELARELEPPKAPLRHLHTPQASVTPTALPPTTANPPARRRRGPKDSGKPDRDPNEPQRLGPMAVYVDLGALCKVPGP